MSTFFNSGRQSLWTAAALLAAAIFILGSAPAQYLGRQEDDLMAALTAQSLADGQGFRLITSPGLPAMNVVSPGLPLFLAPLAYFFPGHFGLFELACALILSGCPCLFWIWLKLRRVVFPDDILLVLLFASSPIILSQSGTLMSECLFLPLTLIFLICMEAESAEIRVWGGGLSLMAAIQTRLAGVFFLPAALARAIQKRRKGEIVRILALTLAPLGVWSYWSLHYSGQIQKIQEGYEFYQGGALSFFLVALRNARYYLISLGSTFLPRSLAGGSLAGALGVVELALVLRGLWAWVKKDVSDSALWVLFSIFILHLTWPWHYDRYLMAPLPLILLAFRDGLRRRAIFILPVLLAAQMIFYLPQWILAQGGFQKIELHETYAWLRSHSDSSALLSSLLYVRDGFYSARPSLPLVFEPSPEDLARVLKAHRARYVLWENNLDLGLSRPGVSPVGAGLRKTQEELQDPRFFEPVYENKREDTIVYRIQ